MAFKVIRQLSPATATTLDFTSSGFGTPAAAIIYATQAAADNTATDHLNLSFGVYDGTNQWCCGGNSEHNQATSDTHRLSSSTVCLLLGTPGTVAAIVSATASTITDGIRLTFTTTTQVLVTVILFSDVGSVWAGSVALSTMNTEVNVTTPGFLPKLLIASSIGHTSAGADFELNFSLGFATATTQKCFEWRITTGAAASNPIATVRSNRIAADASAGWRAEASNFDASGFSLTSRDNNSGGDLVFVLAFECPDNDVWVGGFTNPTGLAQNWDVANGTFQPDFALEVYSFCGAEDTAETDGDAGVFAIGVATATEDMCICLSEEDASDPTDNQSFVDGDTMVRLRNHAGVASTAGEFNSFLSTGRRVVLDASVAGRHFGLQMTSGVTVAPADLAPFDRPPPFVHEIFRGCDLFLEP